MKLKDLFKKKRKPDFSYKGHDFYVCNPNADGKAVNRLSTSRALIYAIALNQLEINLSREDLTKFVTEQESMLRRGDLQNALFMNQMLKTRLQLKTFERGFIDLAKTIILVDDEQEPNNFFDSLKEELLKDEVVKGFFLHNAIRLFQFTKELSSDSEIEDYLKNQEVKEVEAIFQGSISSSK